jgi:hypothetical protein
MNGTTDVGFFPSARMAVDYGKALRQKVAPFTVLSELGDE